MTLTIGSLFAGIGGFDLGFERAGFKTVWQCEIDKAAQGVLRRWFPDASLHSDVCEVGAHNLEPVDVITFGSPCQDLSIAGKRAGLAGGRSGLFHEAARVIRELREQHGKPDFAIWENVPGAFSSNDGRDFAAVVQAMVDLGARDVCWRVLDSRYFGVAQRRRRVFLVADFGGERAEQILFEPESLRGNPKKGRKARKETAGGTGEGATGGGSRVAPFFNQGFCKFDENPVGGTLSARDYKSPNQLLVGTPSAQKQPIAFHPTQDPISSMDGVSHAMSNGSPSGTATATVAVGFDATGSTADASEELHPVLRGVTAGNAGHHTGVAVCATGEVTHALTSASSKGATEDGTGRGTPLAAFLPMQVRRLTPTECEALQGFPRNHTAEIITPDGKIKPQADGPRYKQLGNAVTVNVAEWIAKRLAASMQPPKETP